MRSGAEAEGGSRVPEVKTAEELLRQAEVLFVGDGGARVYTIRNVSAYADSFQDLLSMSFDWDTFLKHEDVDITELTAGIPLCHAAWIDFRYGLNAQSWRVRDVEKMSFVCQTWDLNQVLDGSSDFYFCRDDIRKHGVRSKDMTYARLDFNCSTNEKLVLPWQGPLDQELMKAGVLR
jgi:hypothetical protein